MKTIFTTLIFLLIAQFSFSQTSQTIVAIDSLVRPANATAYAANDVVNDSLSSSNKFLVFKNMTIKATNDTFVVTSKGGGGLITSATLTTDTSNTTNGTFKLLIYKDTIPNVADNAAWVSYGVYNKYFVHDIDFSLTSNGSNAAYAAVSNLSIPFQCTSDNIRLYGVLLAKGAYTPKINGHIIVTLGIIRN